MILQPVGNIQKAAKYKCQIHLIKLEGWYRQLVFDNRQIRNGFRH